MKAGSTITLMICMPVAGLVGCTIATPVVTSGSYENLANADPSKSHIYIYREKAFAGSANQYDVMVNGVLAGSLPNGSFFDVEIEPGENKVEPRTLTAFGFGKGVSITAEQGNSYCFKLTSNYCVQCKSADINPVSKDQCENDIKDLKKVKLK